MRGRSGVQLYSRPFTFAVKMFNAFCTVETWFCIEIASKLTSSWNDTEYQRYRMLNRNGEFFSISRQTHTHTETFTLYLYMYCISCKEN